MPMPVRKMDRANTTGADGHDDHGQLGGEAVQALLQGGLALLGLVHKGGDLAQLGVHAGAGDQHRGPAVGHQGAGEHHVLSLVAQGHLVGIDGLGRLVHALALAGEGGLVDLEGEVLQHPAIGHHHVPGLQQDDVAGHHVGGGDLHPHTAPHHLGRGGGHGLETLQGLLRLLILDGAQDRVEHQHGEDDDGALHIAGEGGDHRCDNEYEYHEILELLQKDLERALFLSLGELVGAVLLRPAAGLLGRTAPPRRRSAPPGPAAVSFCNRPVSYHSFLSQCSPAERRQKKTFRQPLHATAVVEKSCYRIGRMPPGRKPGPWC